MDYKHSSTEEEKTYICLESNDAIYMVPKNEWGIKYTLKIEKHIHGTKEPKIFCKNEACMQFMSVRYDSGLQNELCRHLKSVSAKNSFYPEKTILHDDVIDSISENKYIFKQKAVEKCKALNKLAIKKDKNPLAVFEDGNVKHFLVFSEKIHYNAKLSRFVVSYNPKLGTLDCGCCLRKVTCTHKAMCIWYLSRYEKLPNKDLLGLKENTSEFQNQANTRQS